MSEHLRKNYESHAHENEPNPYDERVARHEAPAHQPEHRRHHHEIEELIKKVEKEADSAEQVQQRQIEQGRIEQQHHIHGAHPTTHASSRQALKTAQKQLSKPERQFSKIVHNTSVEAISETVGATIARPSGLLTAGIFSLLASIGVLFICRFYGYEYNYSIGLMFMLGGFFFGLLLELILKLRPNN